MPIPWLTHIRHFCVPMATGMKKTIGLLILCECNVYLIPFLKTRDHGTSFRGDLTRKLSGCSFTFLSSGWTTDLFQVQNRCVAAVS